MLFEVFSSLSLDVTLEGRISCNSLQINKGK